MDLDKRFYFRGRRVAEIAVSSYTWFALNLVDDAYDGGYYGWLNIIFFKFSIWLKMPFHVPEAEDDWGNSFGYSLHEDSFVLNWGERRIRAEFPWSIWR